MPPCHGRRGGPRGKSLLDNPSLGSLGPAAATSRLDDLKPDTQVPVSIDIHTHSVLAHPHSTQGGRHRRDTSDVARRHDITRQHLYQWRREMRGKGLAPVETAQFLELSGLLSVGTCDAVAAGPRMRQMIEAAGAQLRYLPPYSPDFNPIENAFAKLKALLRKAAERSVSGLWSAIGRIIDLFQSSECANYFMAAGYDAI